MAEFSGNQTMSFLASIVISAGVVGFFTYLFAERINTNINPLLFSLICMFILLLFVITIRLFYLKDAYYSKRFNLTNLDSGQLHVEYLDNKDMSLLQVFVFLFKPMRYVEINEFTLTHNDEKTLSGELKVIGERLYIDNYYLEPNTELFQFIGDHISLTVTGNLRQLIEGNLTKYHIVSVERVI